MGSTVRIWREQLKSSNEEQAGKYQPVVLAYLSSGQVVQVQRMAPESFHCVRVEGALGFGGPPCMLLAHQASIQLLCTAFEITEEQPERTIGFVINNEEQDL